MKKIIFHIALFLLLLSGCTQIVTVPISVAGSVVGTSIDVVGAVISDEEK